MSNVEMGRRKLVTRWNEVRLGRAAEGAMGKRVMDQAGASYVPTEMEIRGAGSFRGRVNDDVADALRTGTFSMTTVHLVATDILNKYQKRTQDAKKRAMDTFMCFLSATGRKGIFFPETTRMAASGWLTPAASAEEQVLCEFAVMRVMAGNAPSTAADSVSHVRTWCDLMLDRKFGKVGTKGKASLTSDYLKAMTVSLYYPEQDSRDERREPVTWPMVQMFVRAAKTQRRADVGVVTALAYAGLFRMGELTSTATRPFSPKTDMSERDVEFFPTFWTATQMVVYIGRTKADQSGKKGKLRPRILPVEAGSAAEMVRIMLAERHGVARGQIPTLRARPLFQDTHGAHLKRDGVMRFMRTVLQAAGWSEARVKMYGTHSCRIGGCTALFQIGASPEVMQMMGGWSSDAYKAYIRIKQQELMSFSRKMCPTSTEKL